MSEIETARQAEQEAISACEVIRAKIAQLAVEQAAADKELELATGRAVEAGRKFHALERDAAVV